MRYKISKLTLCVLIAIGFGLRADGGQIVQSGSYPIDQTNWSEIATLDKFDGTLGSLTSIALTLDGEILANAGYENLAGVQNDVTLNVAADIAATFPTNPMMSQYGFHLTITPAHIGTFANIPINDGLTDFGGAAGQMFSGLAGAASDTLSTAIANAFHPVILALIFDEFTDHDGAAGGLDSIEMKVAASGASLASDVHGNVASLFQTTAGSAYSLVYGYDVGAVTGAVPEPTTLCLSVFGLIGVILSLGRYRRNVSFVDSA
ncbi:MAG: choice-of-anchor E domain-containing protein [Pirellulales bacterium]|nr:choice-of-anchor E domain-containing protein [Pirellulales bacterium]